VLAQHVAAELRAEVARQDLPVKVIAERIDVDVSWVYRKLNGNSPITLPDLEQLCHALGIGVAQLVAPAPPTGFEPATDRLEGTKQW